MAERKTRSTTTGTARAKSPAQESKAQAEFARYKDRVGEGATRAAAFASRLPTSAVPAWSLQPPLPGPPPAAGGPVGWGTPTGPASVDTQSVTQSLGTTIRLGVDVLNAALSSSLTMLGGGVGAAWLGGVVRVRGRLRLLRPLRVRLLRRARVRLRLRLRVRILRAERRDLLLDRHAVSG